MRMLCMFYNRLNLSHILIIRQKLTFCRRQFYLSLTRITKLSNELLSELSFNEVTDFTFNIWKMLNKMSERLNTVMIYSCSLYKVRAFQIHFLTMTMYKSSIENFGTSVPCDDCLTESRCQTDSKTERYFT